MPSVGLTKTRPMFTMNEEPSIKLIKELEQTPNQSQRSLSERCGVSLGPINYCLNVLIKQGVMKASNFMNARNKLSYSYILTPAGLNHKKELTLIFLKLKQAEYESLQREIALLEQDLSQL
jgi:EPS-associated MarR family transcriptional regulator